MAGIRKSSKLSNYSSIDNLSDAVLLALACYSLGGSKKKLHSEDIMAHAFDWDKERFCWTLNKYKKFPDNEKLRKALFAARTKKLVVGAYARKEIMKDGWVLTSDGIELCSSLEHLISVKKSKVSLSQQDKKLLNMFKKNKLLQKIDDDDFSIFHLAEAIDTSPTNIPLMRNKLEKINKLATIDESSNVLEIIKKIKENADLKKIFNEKDYYEQHKIRSRSKNKMNV